jgi:DNA-directed RNA polymerase beta subunit
MSNCKSTNKSNIKNVVDDQLHSPEIGHVQLINRQPPSAKYDLHLCQMERDCLIAHYVVKHLKER